MTQHITFLDGETEADGGVGASTLAFAVNGRVRALALRLLKPRQQQLLAYVAANSGTGVVTRHIRELAALMGCSESTVWCGLLSLKRLGLVAFGDANSKGRPLQLTPLGATIVGGIDDGTMRA